VQSIWARSESFVRGLRAHSERAADVGPRRAVHVACRHHFDARKPVGAVRERCRKHGALEMVSRSVRQLVQ
jgi:hypothetical protein